MAKRMGGTISLEEKKRVQCVTTEEEYKRRIHNYVKNPKREYELKIVTKCTLDTVSKWFVEADKALAQGQSGQKIFTDLRGADMDSQFIHKFHKVIKNQISSAHSRAGKNHYQSCLDVMESELTSVLANTGNASTLQPDNPGPAKH